MARLTILFISLLLMLMSFTPVSHAQKRDFRRYKVKKKKKTVLIPFKSKTLSPAISKMLHENLMSELVKPRVINVINRYPNFNMDAALNMPVHDLDIYKLSEVSDIKYVVLPEIEKKGSGFKLTAEMFDVRRIHLVGRYARECNCPFEDVVFLILPDLANKLSQVKFNLEKKCPGDMVKIAKTTYTMGSSVPYDNNPAVSVRVNNFCIDKYEYPNTLGREPVTGKNWYEAHKLCARLGKRLCSEYEWEYACRGKFNFFYPYGNQYSEEKCNTEGKKAKKSGSFLKCHGENYVYDMSGNINEWTGSNWDANIRNKVIRGGGWFSGSKESRCTLRFSNRPKTRANPIGFRCCLSIK